MLYLQVSRQRFSWRGTRQPSRSRLHAEGADEESRTVPSLTVDGSRRSRGRASPSRKVGRVGCTTAAASADGIGGGISKRLPNARSTGRSMRTRCPNSGSVLLFSDPARLARIRVGVRDTSTFTVQVDVNIAGRWNMAEIALLPRRLAEWSGTPPRWYPLQLGGC